MCVFSCRMLSEDNEALSVLEKRQADMMTESDEMKAMIQQTVQENNQMMHTMDMIMNSAIFKSDMSQKGQPTQPQKSDNTVSGLFITLLISKILLAH